ATIDWGDGTVTVVPAADIQQIGNTNEFQILGSHLYEHDGVYQVTVTVTDADLPPPLVTVVASAPAFIADAPLSTPGGIPVAATEGLALTNVPVFSFVDTNPFGRISDFTASIEWGDGTIGLGTITQPGGVGTPFIVTGNHTYLHNGSYTIKTVVIGSTISGTATAVVADAPL